VLESPSADAVCKLHAMAMATTMAPLPARSRLDSTKYDAAARNNSFSFAAIPRACCKSR